MMEKRQKDPISDVHVVGDHQVNAQHNVILQCIGRLHSHFVARGKEEDVLGLVCRLGIYCRLHFVEEEKALEKINRPQTAALKAEHSLFVMRLESFLAAYEDRTTTENIEEAFLFKGWFLEHIETYERKYTEYKKQLAATMGS